MEFLTAFFALFVSTSDAQALQRMPDTKLTLETAAHHIAGARVAAAVTGLAPDLLLAISYFESRYEIDAVGPTLRNNKRACGVMQHVPVTRCPEPSLLRDYVAGAQHLATWVQAQKGDLDRALIGYSGGYALLQKCDRGEAPRACSIAKVHKARTLRIKRMRRVREET